MGKKEEKFMEKDLPKDSKLTPTQEQMITSKYKQESKMALEELKHKNIMEEIERLEKAKVTFFNRN